MAVKKPKRVPIEGAWRVTESRRFEVSRGYEYPRKYLYDNDVSFEQQLKTKKTSAAKWYTTTGEDNIRIVAEQFDGKAWVQISEWVGPKKNPKA